MLDALDRIVALDVQMVRLSNNYVQAKIKEYRRLIGIVVPTSAHSLRHGFATYLAEKGASPVAIQRLLGHESLQTTSKYVHSTDKYAEQVHNKFHPLRNVTNPPEGKTIDNNNVGNQIEDSESE